MTLSRRNVVIAAIAATWLVLLLLTFFLVRSSQQTASRTGQAEPSPVINRPATEEEKANMLFNRSEQQNAERDYNAKVGKRGAVVDDKTGFTFKLAPSLQSPTSPTPEALRRVLGVVSMCNIDTAPQTVSVYDLKSHWLAEEAQNLALEYGVDSESYALPTDASSFQFQFTNKTNTAYFSLYEASGVYKYHLSGQGAGGGLSAAQLREKANMFMANRRLNTRISPPSATNTPKGGGIYTYKRILDDFKITDHAGVMSVVNSSICSVPDTVEMGEIDIEVRSDGVVSNVAHNARTIVGTYRATRLSLEDAVKEYQNTQPVDPIVIPPGSTVRAGDVTIESAVLAYYDIGTNFGQSLYVPIYIAQGTVGGAQVVAFFPAVSSTEMLKKGLIKTAAKPGNAASQQQGTLGFATPTQHIPPPPPQTGPVTGPGCPGGLVDYMVKCSVAGRSVCIGIFSADSKVDPLGACASACKTSAGTVSYQSGVSPCEAFLDSKGIPPAEPGQHRSGNIDSSGLKNGDPVSCSVQGCPC